MVKLKEFLSRIKIQQLYEISEEDNQREVLPNTNRKEHQDNTVANSVDEIVKSKSPVVIPGNEQTNLGDMIRPATGIPEPTVDHNVSVKERNTKTESQRRMFDLGEITLLSPKAREFSVDISRPATTNCSICGVTVEPKRLSSPGSHTLQLVIDAEKLTPGALIEGEIVLNTRDGLQEVWVTGMVADFDTMTSNHSEVINNRPWQLHATLKSHTDKVKTLTFIRNSMVLVSGSADHTIRRWDIETVKEIDTPEYFDSEVWSLASSRDGEFLAIGLKDGTIILEESTSQHILWQQRVHEGMISSLVFSPNNDLLISGSGDRSIRILDVKTGKPTTSPLLQKGVVTSLALSGNGHLLASTSQTRKTILWELKTGQQVRKLEGHSKNVWCVAFSIDGYMLATGSSDKTVLLWDANEGTINGILKGFRKDIFSVAISPDGTIIATASGEPKVRIWDTHSSIQLANLDAGNRLIGQLVFSPNQRYLAGASDDNNVYIWTVR